jgi:adenine phosphoribosyltransferase
MDPTNSLSSDLAGHIREIPDWPKKGILFYDITTLLADAGAFKRAVDGLAAPFQDKHVDVVVSVEARGFIFGGALAHVLGAGFVPARKPGKLPYDKIRVEYALEYGTDAIEMHSDAVKPGQRVLIFDDVLATGGTVAATAELVQRLGGKVVSVAFLSELTFLNGRERLKGLDVFSLIKY